MARAPRNGSARVAEAARTDPVTPFTRPTAALTPATARRRPVWALGGALLVGIAALLGAWILLRANERISVIVAARNLDAGVTLAADDVRVIEIGATDQLRAITPGQQDLVLGHATRGPVPAGTVLNTDLFTGKGQSVPAGSVVVSAALDPGAAPIGVRAGDPVRLYIAARLSGGQATAADATLLGDGVVWSVARDDTTNAAASKASIALLVPVELQQRAVQAAYEGTLRLGLTGGGA